MPSGGPEPGPSGGAEPGRLDPPDPYRPRPWILVSLFLFLSLATACAPRIAGLGPTITDPMLTDTAFLSPDGENHRLIRHLPDDRNALTATVVALHGMNDRAEAFDGLGQHLAQNGIALYAYDHRGFGASSTRGIWPGIDALAADAKRFLGEVRARHPGRPLYLLGESMGGALAMVMMTSPAPPHVDGVILSAPAVWGRATMPFYQRWMLDMSSMTLPWVKLSGNALDIRASDNIEMLRELGRDPLVIKETRVDVIAGVTDLMDAALAAAPDFDARTLILYGERDEVVPPDPTLDMVRALPAETRGRGPGEQEIALYENGWHLLLRDLDAERVWADIRSWIETPRAPLPSGADTRGAAWRDGRHAFRNHR